MKKKTINITRSPHPLKYVDKIFKIIVIGDKSVGKTSLISRAVTGEFKDYLDTTICPDISAIFYKYKELRFKLQLWDTCELEQYQTLNKVFYHGADVVLLLYSPDNVDTVNSSKKWLEAIRANCKPNIKIYLVGTKHDLNKTNNASEEFKNFVESNEIQGNFEVSSKTGFGIEEMLNQIFKHEVASYEENTYHERRSRLSSGSFEPRSSCPC